MIHWKNALAYFDLSESWGNQGDQCVFVCRASQKSSLLFDYLEGRDVGPQRSVSLVSLVPPGHGRSLRPSSASKLRTARCGAVDGLEVSGLQHDSRLLQANGSWCPA